MKNLLNLCLHSGANEAKMEDVRKVETPAATDTWCPIGHAEYIDSVLETLAGNGLRVVNEAHALWSGGNRYFGSFQLANGDDHGDYALVVGLRNSHDKTFPAGLACGSGVFVCDNLAFSGEVRLSRKHTSGIRRDLPRLVSAAVGRLGELKVDQEKRIACYKDRILDDRDAHDIVIRSIDAKACPVTRIPEVIAQWRKPAHEEFAPRTAWSLFNGFTEALKGTSVATLSARTIPLHGLFDQFCGLRVMHEEFEDAEIVAAL